MISFIKGTISYKDKGSLIVDNHGIGYAVTVPDPVFDGACEGGEIFLYTHFQVREDGICLFGFESRNELELFRDLISVTGIGPRVSIAILSTLSAQDLVLAIFNEDIKAITRAPGIGPKGAKRLIMELKDKLDLNEFVTDTGIDPEAMVRTEDISRNDEINDAVLALEALGYPKTQAKEAVLRIPDLESLDSGRILKEALKYIR